MTEEEKKLPCSVCGQDMYDPKTKNTVTGIHIGICVKPGEEEGAHSEYKRVIKVFGKNEFDICYVCWLRALGVKPKKQEVRKRPN